MQGKIIKGIAGFYYVNVEESGVYECKAKGIFRKEKRKPLVGDNVELEVLDEEEFLGNITNILPRENELIRPAAANIDQAMVIFALDKPKPNLNLLDRFLLMMECQEIPIIICFNKKDIVSEAEMEELKQVYRYYKESLIFTCALEGGGVQEIKKYLMGKNTILAGPSGVGKSTLINHLQQNVKMETGAISEKIGRGKHTTRHSELIYVDQNTYVMDTPGFSSLHISDFDKDDLKKFYRDFGYYEELCRFKGCSHVNEQICGVKDAVMLEKISRIRYDNYVEMYKELKKQRRY